MSLTGKNSDNCRKPLTISPYEGNTGTYFHGKRIKFHIIVIHVVTIELKMQK